MTKTALASPDDGEPLFTPSAVQAELLRLMALYAAVEEAKGEKAAKSVTQYLHDPAGFARDCIDWDRVPKGADENRGEGTEGLAPYQAEILDLLDKRKRVAVRGPRGLGKALQLNVRIPTPSGWSTVGDLRPGDEIFDEHGKPCRVVAKSPVWHGDTYEVEFADGSVITTHGAHEWNAVDQYKDRPPGMTDWRDHWAVTRLVTTEHMAGTLRVGKRGDARWRIPAARPLELPEAPLPVDPYIFGYWLGDGRSDGSVITVHQDDWPGLLGHIGRAGYHHGKLQPHRKRPSTFAVTVSTQPVRRGGNDNAAGTRDTLARKLRELGVLNGKHIPMLYLRASVAQRMELVRGLWDSDGYRQAGGSDEITLTCKPLAGDVAELLRSLGLVVRMSESDSKINGRVVGRRWRIAARFDFNPYHLARYDWQPRGAQASRHTQRTIVDIRKVADQPTQCIEVDSPSHLYLAGDSMIPTHNSVIGSIAVLWFALTREAAGIDWKIATTAASWDQLRNYFWPEVHKWAQYIRWDIVRAGKVPRGSDELMRHQLRLKHGHAFAAAPSDSAKIEGAHASAIMIMFDEAKGIPAPTWDAVEGALNGRGEALALALSTPGDPQGRFYDIHSRRKGLEDWTARHVTLEEAIAAGQISRAWADQRIRQYGLESQFVQCHVLGEFHAADEDSVIPLSWIEAAVQRHHAWVSDGRPELAGLRVTGVDVARAGEDMTVFAIRIGPVITELRRYAKQDTMATSGRVKGILDADPAMSAIVDTDGVGGGVYDRLREQGARCEPFTASKAAGARRDKTGQYRFSDWRSYAYWRLREALDPRNDPDICLPDEDLLTGDLCAPKYLIESGARIRVESKKEIRKRLNRSTDDGDAVVFAWSAEESSWLDAYASLGVSRCDECSRGYASRLGRCPHCGAAAAA